MKPETKQTGHREHTKPRKYDPDGKLYKHSAARTKLAKLELIIMQLEKERGEMQACLFRIWDACRVMRERIPISDTGLKDALWDMARQCHEAATGRRATVFDALSRKLIRGTKDCEPEP